VHALLHHAGRRHGAGPVAVPHGDRAAWRRAGLRPRAGGGPGRRRRAGHRVPVYPSGPGCHPRRRRARRMNSSPSSRFGLPMVYLVDDEDVVRDALAWLLRTRRLLSEGYASGDAFAEFLRGKAPGDWPNAPSCVLLDVRMPGLSGLALFDQLVERGLTELLPVIFLTGHGDVPTAVAAVKRGAFDFVEKPFSDNALVDRIEQALQRSEATLARRADKRRVERALAE